MPDTGNRDPAMAVADPERPGKKAAPAHRPMPREALDPHRQPRAPPPVEIVGGKASTKLTPRSLMAGEENFARRATAHREPVIFAKPALQALKTSAQRKAGALTRCLKERAARFWPKSQINITNWSKKFRRTIRRARASSQPKIPPRSTTKRILETLQIQPMHRAASI